MNFFFIKHFRWLLLRFGNYKLISLNLSKILITLKSKKILMPWSSSSSWVHNSLSNSLPNPGQSEKIKLNFYFRTSLWCLKRFYEGLHKTFWGTTKKCENKNLTQFLFQYRSSNISKFQFWELILRNIFNLLLIFGKFKLLHSCSKDILIKSCEHDSREVALQRCS